MILYERDRHGHRLNLRPPGEFRLIGLCIEPETLDLVIGRREQGKRARLNGRASRLSPVSDYSVEFTRLLYPSCRCEEIGLYAGMTLDALQHLGAGCTAGHHVCSRLDRIRREHNL